MATSEKKLIAVHCAKFCPPPTLHCVGLNPQENATLWHFSFAGFLFANYGEKGGGGHCIMASDGRNHNNLTHTQNNLRQPRNFNLRHQIIQESVNMLIGSNSKCKIASKHVEARQQQPQSV